MVVGLARQDLHRGLILLGGGLALTLLCSGMATGNGVVIFTGAIFLGLGTVIGAILAMRSK